MISRDRVDVAREVALLESKAATLSDCLGEYPESLLFLHSLVLDHEGLLDKLRAARRRAAAFPKGFHAYDEGFDADDGRLEDLDLDDLDAHVGLAVGAQGTADGKRGPDDEDHEALDQSRLASLAQIRACLRSIGMPTSGQGDGSVGTGDGRAWDGREQQAEGAPGDGVQPRGSKFRARLETGMHPGLR